MSREEIRNLIGGYATGNLTEAERAALFAAVLEDQDLFDTLAREQPLAELLDDPSARARVLAALGEPEVPWRARLRGWVRRPAVAALAASGAVAVVAVLVLVPRGERREEAKPVQVAEARKVAVPAPVAPAPAPAPAPQKPKPRAKAKPPAKPEREDVRREEAAPAEQVRVEAQAPAPAAADSAVRSAFQMRPPVVARSSYWAEHALLRATAVRMTPDGSYETLGATGGVTAGDTVRLRVQPAAPGFLRVIQRETEQGWRPVFSGKVEAGRTYFVPAEGGLRLERGRREFVLTLSVPDGPAPQASERVVVEVK